VVLINLRLKATAKGAAATFQQLGAAFAEHAAKEAPVESSREAYFGPQTGRVHTRVIQRASLLRDKCQGPAIIEEFDSTIVVPPRWSASLDRLGNVVMESQPGREA